jgi:hypothetical protein
MKNLPLCDDHAHEKGALGKILNAGMDKRGYVEVDFEIDEKQSLWHADVVNRMRKGEIVGLSLGWKNHGIKGSDKWNGIYHRELKELSVTNDPRMPEAKLTAVEKRAPFTDLMRLEIERDLGKKLQAFEYTSTSERPHTSTTTTTTMSTASNTAAATATTTNQEPPKQESTKELPQRDEQGRFVATTPTGATKRSAPPETDAAQDAAVSISQEEYRLLLSRAAKLQKQEDDVKLTKFRAVKAKLPAIAEYIASLKAENKEVDQETLDLLDGLQKADENKPDHLDAMQGYSALANLTHTAAVAHKTAKEKEKAAEEKLKAMEKVNADYQAKQSRAEEVRQQVGLTSTSTVASKTTSTSATVPDPFVTKAPALVTKDSSSGAIVFGTPTRARFASPYTDARHPQPRYNRTPTTFDPAVSLFQGGMFASNAKEHEDVKEALQQSSSASRGQGNIDYVSKDYFEKKKVGASLPGESVLLTHQNESASKGLPIRIIDPAFFLKSD